MTFNITAYITDEEGYMKIPFEIDAENFVEVMPKVYDKWNSLNKDDLKVKGFNIEKSTEDE